MSEMFGKKLKELRLDGGYSQKQLGEIFHVTNVTISSWENNKQEPCLDDVCKIAEFFGVSTDCLLGVQLPNIIIKNYKSVDKNITKLENTMLLEFRNLSKEKQNLIVKLLEVEKKAI